MYYWNFELDEFEELSKEEMRKIFQEKAGDDFDNNYNIMTFQEFYQPDSRFSEIFWNVDYRLSSLHRYLEYSRRYISGYLKEGVKYGKSLLENREETAEEFDMYCETFYSDKEYLPEYNYESIFLMLYTMYEKFLYQLVLEVGEMAKTKFDNNNYNGALVVRYLTFLNKTCKMNINIKDEVWKKFDIIRKIRNIFIHNGGVVHNKSLCKTIEKEFPILIKQNRAVLNYDFLIVVFEIVGSLLYSLEEKYWKLDLE